MGRRYEGTHSMRTIQHAGAWHHGSSGVWCLAPQGAHFRFRCLPGLRPTPPGSLGAWMGLCLLAQGSMVDSHTPDHSAALGRRCAVRLDGRRWSRCGKFTGNIVSNDVPGRSGIRGRDSGIRLGRHSHTEIVGQEGVIPRTVEVRRRYTDLCVGWLRESAGPRPGGAGDDSVSAETTGRWLR